MTTLASIGNSLISSTILFGAPVWSQTSEANIAQVQRAQTKVARLVSGKNSWGFNKNRTHRQEIFELLGWKNTKQLIATANLNLLKRAMEKQTAQSICNMVKASIPAHPRGPTAIRAEHTGKAFKNKNSFVIQATKEYNLLPDTLRSPLLTAKAFKIRLKEHILTMHPLPTHNNN